MVLKPVQMGKIAVLGLRKDKQIVISILHDLNAVQLESLSENVAAMLRNERDNDLFREVSDQLLRMKALKTVLPSKEVTQCQRFTSVEHLLNTAKSIDIDAKVAALEKEKESLLTQVKETENNIKLAEEFSFFPEDFNVLQLKTAHSYFCRIDSKNYPAFRKALDVNIQDVFLYAKEGKDSITHLVLVTFPNFPSHALATLVQEYDVKIEAAPKLEGKSDQLVQKLKARRSDISNKLSEIDSQLTEIAKNHYVNIVCIEEQLEIENKKLEVIDNLGVTSDSFALEGWIPKKTINQLRNTLEQYTKATMLFELETDEHPPTQFDNPKRFRLYEAFVRFYSLPEGKEFDPTLIFGLIFPVFYGMMVGDAGYGLVILLVCRWVIRRVDGGKKNMNIMPTMLRKFALTILKKRQMAKLARAMTPGAIIAIILGFLFNLYFGFHLNGYLFNYLNSMFGLHLPSDGTIFSPIHSLRKLLLISGYIGLGMVTFGLVLGIINTLREGGKKHAIGKMGWLVFGWGVVLTGLALMHHQHVNPIHHTEGILYVGLIGGGIGLMFVGEGPRAIMELPSIVSHILSYTRIVGILLASVILADVIDFIFVKTLHHTIPFIVLGTVILFIGHIFNIIIGVFEPGIQGARLIYVEFFSKFYHGNGRPFRPFGSTRRYTYNQYELEAKSK